jgi:hypothetical protein
MVGCRNALSEAADLRNQGATVAVPQAELHYPHALLHRHRVQHERDNHQR